MSDRRRLAPLALVVMAACADSADRVPEPEASPASSAADVLPPGDPVMDTAAAPLADSALVATVRRGPARRFSISGETRAAGILEMTMEDGHRILFGPTELEVEDGRFHHEFVAEPTTQQVSTVFLTTPDGARQWVIALPADSQQVRFGPS